MASPPMSPSRGLQGASRTSGGILRGRAHGNVFNLADAEFALHSESKIGKVMVFDRPGNPKTAEPIMVLRTEATTKLKPILKSLARNYSPVRSKHHINI